MTHEEIMVLDAEALESRMTEIRAAIDNNEEGADFAALALELDAIKERKAVLADEARKADIKAVIDGEGTTDTSIELPKEKRDMADIKEIRASEEYVNAFANYIKTGKDTECRALLSELATGGVVPVPTFVEDEIRTAWNENKLLSRVKKSYLKGILKVGFEISATGAAIHNEGAVAPSEETLVIGIVELKPASIKKWITISDEVIDLKGEAFLRYIYDELTYQIAKKAEEELLDKIEACGTVSTNTATTNVAVPVIAAQATLGLIASAVSELSDRAADPVIVMNKQTYATFKALQYAASYAVDPFEGLEVIFNNHLASYEAATTGVTYMIVGDFGVGAQANFPEGDGVSIKYDDLSLAESDLVKIVGREYIGMGVVAPNAFVKVQKPAAE